MSATEIDYYVLTGCYTNLNLRIHLAYLYSTSLIFPVSRRTTCPEESLIGVITLICLSVCLSEGLLSAPQYSADFTIRPFNGQWASLTDHTGFLLPGLAYNALKTMIISLDQFRTVVFCMNVCVAVAESVRCSSVAVVSGIYYSDH